MHKLVNGIEVPLTEKEILDFEARQIEHETKLAAYEKVKYKDQRAAEYPSINDMVVAIIEKYGEGRAEAFDTLMAQRAATKLKYPKPF